MNPALKFLRPTSNKTPNSVRFDGDLCHIELKRLDGTLLYAVCDAASYESIKAFRWYASPDNRSKCEKFYANANVFDERTGSTRTIGLHWLLFGVATPGMHVDHIDGRRTLDCSSQNCQVLTHKANVRKGRKDAAALAVAS